MHTTTVNLRAVAATEARQLTTVRGIRLNHDGPAAQPCQYALRARRDPRGQGQVVPGPLISRARGARRRRALGGRTLFIWQVGCEDTSGRTAANAIVAMLVRLEADRYGDDLRRRIRGLVNEIDSQPPDAIDCVLRTCQRAVVEVCRAHAQTRLTRERAIAARLSKSTSAAAYQAGLFDRRSERAYRLRAAETQAFEDLAQARVLVATSAAMVSASRPRLLLVLTP